MSTELNLQPSIEQLMPANHQIQYSYFLIDILDIPDIILKLYVSIPFDKSCFPCDRQNSSWSGKAIVRDEGSHNL
jgi:hypothetical protein